MKKILIALDYESSAGKIAEAGKALAEAMNAKATLLHVVADPVYYSSRKYSPILGFEENNEIETIQTDKAEELHVAAERFLDTIKSRLGGDHVNIMVGNGDFGKAILDAADEIKADMIVLGSHHRHGIEKMLAGSVSEYVLHHSRKPLFIVPVVEKS